MKALLLASTVAFLAACVPVRNEYSPSVNGLIVSSGTAQEGVSICVKAAELKNPRCVQSDANGRFHVQPIKNFELASVADHYTFYELTIATQESGSVIGYSGDFSVGMVESVALICDLKKPIHKGCAASYCERVEGDSGRVVDAAKSGSSCEK